MCCVFELGEQQNVLTNSPLNLLLKSLSSAYKWELYEDAAVLPLSVLRNMHVRCQKLMSSHHITFAFFAQKSIFDLGVSSNRVHRLYIVGLIAVPCFLVISTREGTAPAEGDFWTEFWLVKSAAFMWMGQQWHFQAIPYVNAQRERAAGARKGEMTSRWMKHAMKNMKCFCLLEGAVLSFGRMR